MPINPKSSWPFMPFVVHNVMQIEAAAKQGASKKEVITKIVERFFRAGAMVMFHYGMPAEVALKIARDQIVREGGKVAKARLDACEALKNDTLEKKVLNAQEQTGDLIAGWLSDAAKPADKEIQDDDGNEED